MVLGKMFGSEREESLKILHCEEHNNINCKPDTVRTVK
jgi:hypothetical protein